MENIIKSCGVLILKETKVLLVKHKESAHHLTNTYGILAGRLKENESEINCAIRELKEETNLEVLKEDLIQLSKIYYADIKRKTQGVKSFSIKVFICNKFFGELKSNNETIPIWINISDINNLNLLPNVKKIIKEGLNN